MKKMNKKGFTLIEMLVVIAIIAILVSIIIPVVSSSTDKAKAATNAANLRSLKAELVTNMLTGDGSVPTTDVAKAAASGTTFYGTDGKKFTDGSKISISGTTKEFEILCDGKNISDWAGDAGNS